MASINNETYCFNFQNIAPDGTVYIEVAFDKDKENKKKDNPVPARRYGQPTEYAEVDFNRPVPPPKEPIYE